mmetsp:Transcript_23849/g.35232  ORF Transcript_23849/g.35232 Transcript_23849/m.35232 type:complete len:230 (+) Transcript_23849:3989-4678(+)
MCPLVVCFFSSARSIIVGSIIVGSFIIASIRISLIVMRTITIASILVSIILRSFLVVGATPPYPGHIFVFGVAFIMRLIFVVLVSLVVVLARRRLAKAIFISLARSVIPVLGRCLTEATIVRLKSPITRSIICATIIVGTAIIVCFASAIIIGTIIIIGLKRSIIVSIVVSTVIIGLKRSIIASAIFISIVVILGMWWLLHTRTIALLVGFFIEILAWLLDTWFIICDV